MVTKFKASHHSVKFLIFTGIPEYPENWSDDDLTEWDDQVTDFLLSIPNVGEVESYGEYSVVLSFNSGEAIPYDVVSYVQSFIDDWSSKSLS